MDGLGAEVSAKIRSAIKAKLIELEAYVDDELPDYIMVMVANNRTKLQMEDDLGLFLNNNTATFTNWLHAVLEKLKKVTLEEVSKKETKKKKSKKVSSEKPVKKPKEKSSKEPRSTSMQDRKTENSSKNSKGSSSRSSKPPRSGQIDRSSANANMEELGKRKKRDSSARNIDDSGGADGYNPASLLKSALQKTKQRQSPKKSTKKSSVNNHIKKDSKKREHVKEQDREEKRSHLKKSRNIINLKEEVDFYPSKEKARDENRRFRSRSPPAKIVSLVSKVVKPTSRSRPVRESSRHRSRSFTPPDKDYPRTLSSRAYVPPRPSRPVGREDMGVARAVGKAIMEADQSIIKNRREDPSDKRKGRREENIERRLRRQDCPKEIEITGYSENRRSTNKIRSSGRGRLAMDQEVSRNRRASSSDTGILAKHNDAGDMRIVIRRELTPEGSVTPPKKMKLDDEDVELLEMRRKALESLQKKTDRQLSEKHGSNQKRHKSITRRVGLAEEESASSSSSDSEVTTDNSNYSDDEGSSHEPTFVVTLDGINEKFFKSQQKGALELARERLEQTSELREDRDMTKFKYRSGNSGADLELHPNEDFDTNLKKKKPVHEVNATRKWPPTLNTEPLKSSGGKKIAEVRPVIATVPVPSKCVAPMPPSSTQPAGSFAAKLSAIKAAKVTKTIAQNSTANNIKLNNSNKNEDVNNVTATTQKSKVEVGAKPTTVTQPSKCDTLNSTKPETKSHTAKSTTTTTLIKPVVKRSTQLVANKVVPTKAKVPRTPIMAPSPDPTPTLSKTFSAPNVPRYSQNVNSSKVVCRYWPACKRKDSCAFFHPQHPNSAEAILSTSAVSSKFKWSAK